MKLIFSALTLVSTLAFAETGTFEISGMTCNSCVSAVKKSVCGMNSLEKCEVVQGKVTLQSKAGAKIDTKEIEKLVEQAGHYKITKASVK